MHRPHLFLPSILIVSALCASLAALGCSSSDDASPSGSPDGGSQEASSPEAGSDSSQQPGPDASADSSAQDSSAPTDASAQDSSAPTEDASSDSSLQEASSPEAQAPESAVPDSGPDAIVVQSCSELSATECFSNYDCPSDTRCQSVGTLDWPVACCVPGPRGTLGAGQPASSENDCASGMRMEFDSAGETQALCSDRCTSDEDCPAALHTCMYIAFSSSTDKWCSPTQN